LIILLRFVTWDFKIEILPSSEVSGLDFVEIEDGCRDGSNLAHHGALAIIIAACLLIGILGNDDATFVFNDRAVLGSPRKSGF
jgi:hypothetical protein